MTAAALGDGRRFGSLLIAALGLLAPAAAGCHRSSRLLPRADGAAVVLAPAETANPEPGVAYAAELEPNGTLATAQRLDLVEAAALGISGKLDPAADPKGKDVDIYRLVVPAPAGAAPTAALAGKADGAAPAGVVHRRLSAEIRPEATLAVSVEALDDAGGSLLVASGGAPGEVEGFPNLAVTPGTYYLRVRAAPPAGQGSYRLVVRLVPAEAGEEQEPNGKSALAGELPPAGEAIGYFGWRKDQDWYRVPLAGVADGSVLSADLEPVPGISASLLVFDSAERKLSEARGRKEERVAVRNIRLPPGEPNLFLEVRTDAGRNLEVRYNLAVRTELPKAGGELEPNDDPQHANPITDGTVLGYLARGDVDVYRYTAAEPLELDVEAAPPERVDLKLEVIREPDGLLLVRADSGKRHEPERLPNLFVAPGSLLIRLTGGKGDGNLDEPYHLSVASHRPEPGAEREPNGTAASATPLPAGATGNGLLFPRGDVDFWRAAAAPDAEGNVAVTATGMVGMTLELRVLSLAEKELGRFKLGGEAPVTNRLAVGGEACCLIQLREASGKAADFHDRYTVTMGVAPGR
jgi:hypothetical protein